MCAEVVDFFATAPDGDALPFLHGIESLEGLKILSITRTADQIRVRAVREGADCGPPATPPALSLPPLHLVRAR
jgi:hypothetical protein